MSRKSLAFAFAALVACAAVYAAAPAVADNVLTPNDAPGHIGDTATVCGVVASTRYAAGTKGQPVELATE
jgi:hypothetical protein